MQLPIAPQPICKMRRFILYNHSIKNDFFTHRQSISYSFSIVENMSNEPSSVDSSSVDSISTPRSLTIPIQNNSSSSCPVSPAMHAMPSIQGLSINQILKRPSTPDFKPVLFSRHRSPSSSSRRSPIHLKRESPIPIEDPYQKGFEDGYNKAMADVAYREKKEVKITLRSNSPQLLQMLTTTQLQSLMEIKETLKKAAMDNTLPSTNESTNES